MLRLVFIAFYCSSIACGLRGTIGPHDRAGTVEQGGPSGDAGFPAGNPANAGENDTDSDADTGHPDTGAGAGPGAGAGSDVDSDTDADTGTHDDNRQVVPFDMSQVALLPSRFSENRDRTLAYLRFLDPDRMLHMFRVTAGIESSAQPLGGWDAPDVRLRGHSMGHFLVALSQAYASTGEVEYRDKVDYLIDELGTCQDALHEKMGAAEGFLSAYDESQFVELEELTPYPEIWAPYYTLHKILAGIIAAYRLADSERALEIASKLGVWVFNRLSNVPKERLQEMWQLYIAGEYGGMNEVLADLYSITGDERHLTAATYFDNDGLFDSSYNNIDRLDGKHANQHIPQVVGAMRVFEQTQNPFYYQLADNFWHIVVDHHSYVIGGTGEGEMFRRADEIAGTITDKTAETCATYNMLKLTRYLFFHNPQPEYMDYYERALYNHILASQDPRSSHGFTTYFVPLSPGGRKSYSDDYHSFTCCHGTGMENHTKYQESIYFRTRDSTTLFVNLFIPSLLDWSVRGLTVTQTTGFPDEEGTLLTINGSGHLIVMVRVPIWARNGYAVDINGTVQSVSAEPGTYVALERDWLDGDQISISMPFGFSVEKTPDNADIASILYGPVVLAGDSSRGSYISLSLSTQDLSQSIVSAGASLRFSVDGLDLMPFYDAQNTPYHAYFQISRGP